MSLSQPSGAGGARDKDEAGQLLKVTNKVDKLWKEKENRIKVVGSNPK